MFSVRPSQQEASITRRSSSPPFPGLDALAPTPCCMCRHPCRPSLRHLGIWHSTAEEVPPIPALPRHLYLAHHRLTVTATAFLRASYCKSVLNYPVSGGGYLRQGSGELDNIAVPKQPGGVVSVAFRRFLHPISSSFARTCVDPSLHHTLGVPVILLKGGLWIALFYPHLPAVVLVSDPSLPLKSPRPYAGTFPPYLNHPHRLSMQGRASCIRRLNPQKEMFPDVSHPSSARNTPMNRLGETQTLPNLARLDHT